MPGLVPGIHVLKAERAKDVDGRDEPGHDTEEAVTFILTFVTVSVTQRRISLSKEASRVTPAGRSECGSRGRRLVTSAPGRSRGISGPRWTAMDCN
jgi:hypothetical protein